MTLADLQHVQRYFKEEEQRDLTMTELKVLDTYWSDHCRHTTFETILQNVTIKAGKLQETIQKAYDTYLQLREEVHGGRKVMTLMDMATIGGKTLRKRGKLEDLEISDEINACSIEVKVDVDGEEQDWLLMFKKMKRTTTLLKSSRSAVPAPASAERSATRCPEEAMYIRPCVLPEPVISRRI